MEGFPPGAWDLARPNITTWASDLMQALPSQSLNTARDKIFDVGRRIDQANRVLMHERDESDEEFEEVRPPPSAIEVDDEEEGEDLVKNDPAVGDIDNLLILLFDD